MKNSLQKLIKEAKFDSVNSYINDKNFPEEKVRGEVEILNFGKDITNEEAIKKMDKQGYVPANIYELLEYAKKGWNGLDWVVAPGSVWQPFDGRRFVACLYWSVGDRSLYLRWWSSGWTSDYRFAAIRKSSESGKLEPLKPSDALPIELVINGVKYVRKDK